MAIGKPIRNEIAKIEGAISECPTATFGDSPDCPLFHSFSDGIYVREIQIPAGKLLVGKIHKHEHPNFLLRGKVSVLTEDGGMEYLEAPCYMISPAGTKRVVYVHEDCCWVTVHKTDAENPEEAEGDVIATNYEDAQLNDNQIKSMEKVWLG